MRIHLVRHGEVQNPDHVVYADIAGFRLSALGRAQAVAAGEHLADSPIAHVVSSPLERAQQTADAIAFRHDLVVHTDDRLTEWGLSLRWAATPWDSIPALFPGELEAYLAHPTDLPFSPESIQQTAARMVAAIHDAVSDAVGDVVVVSHQDPVQAARLQLTGRSLDQLPHDKPGHASIVTVEVNDAKFTEVGYWEPPGRPFPPPAH